MTDIQQSFENPKFNDPLFMVVVPSASEVKPRTIVYATILRFGSNVITVCPSLEPGEAPPSVSEAHALSTDHAEIAIVDNAKGGTTLKGGLNDYALAQINTKNGAITIDSLKHPDDTRFGLPSEEAREITTAILQEMNVAKAL